MVAKFVYLLGRMLFLLIVLMLYLDTMFLVIIKLRAGLRLQLSCTAKIRMLNAKLLDLPLTVEVQLAFS